MSRLSAAALVLASAAVAAHADPRADAKPHVDAAAAAHAAGDFPTALEELAAAYAIDPQPELLFAQGQVLAKLDRCAEAIDFYTRFRATQQDRDARAITQQAIDACKKTLASAPQPQPEPTPARPAEPPHPPPPPPARDRPFYVDPVGDGLALGGVAAGVVAGVLYGRARGELDTAERAATLADYQTHVDRAHTDRTVAIVLAAAGAVAIAGGVARFALHHERESPALALAPVPSGGGLLVWQGGW